MHFRGSCLSLEKATFVALDFVKLSHLFDFSPFWYQEDQKLVSFSASERGLYPLTVPERDVMPTFPDSEYVRNILCEIYRNNPIIIACGGLVEESIVGCLFLARLPMITRFRLARQGTGTMLRLLLSKKMDNLSCIRSFNLQ